MRNTCFIFLASLLLPLVASAQPRYGDVLRRVEDNSLALRSIQARFEAETAAVRADAYLSDPRIEMDYKWASQRDIGNKWGITVTQEFQFPSVYRCKHLLKDDVRNEARLQFLRQRQQYLLDVQLICADLIYQNAMVRHYGECLENISGLVAVYRQRMSQGDCNILDYNMVQTELTLAGSRYDMACLHRDELLRRLAVANGGNTVDFRLDTFDSVVLPASFDTLFDSISASCYELLLADNDVASHSHAVTLRRAEWLPTIDAGYASENESGVLFRGATLALNIPLWQRAYSVRSAKIAQQEAVLSYEDLQLSMRQYYSGLYNQAWQLSAQLQRLDISAGSSDAAALLYKALTIGDMSLESYLRSVEFYHELEISALNIRHELEQVWLKLMAYKL